MRARPPALPWQRRPAARALAGACAIGTLRWSLARHAARALGLRRFAGWLRALTAPPPSLVEEEPLGILPTLVSDPAPQAADDGWRAGGGGRAERARGGRKPGRRARSLDDGRRQRRGRAAQHVDHEEPARSRAALADAGLLPSGGAPVPTLPRAAVVRDPLPPPAGAAARGPAPPQRAAHTRALPKATAQGSRRAGRAARGPATTLAEVLAARADGRVAATLAEVLAARAKGRLAAVVDAAAAAGAAASTRGAKDPDGPPPAADAVRTALEQQWVTSLGGRRAPADLLWRLIDDPGSAGAADAPATRRGRAPSTGGGLPAPNPRVVAPPPPLQTASPRAPLAPVRAMAADVPARGLGAPTEAGTRLRLPAVDDAQPDDDLDALAANVQRILDREARRHGIDV